MEYNNANLHQKASAMTIVRGKAMRLELCLPAGVVIRQHQSLEVALTILPPELANLSETSDAGPPVNPGHEPQVT